MGNIVGIGHDLWIASSALYQNGEFKKAFPEERLNRLKGFQGFPSKSISKSLSELDLKIKDIDLHHSRLLFFLFKFFSNLSLEQMSFQNFELSNM